MSAIKKPKMPNEGFVEAIPRPDNISLFPSRGIDKAVPEEPKRSWIFRRLVELGVIVMPNTQPKTPGFYVNWTTVTGIIALLVFIGGLFAFTANVFYQQGQKDEQNRQRDEQIKTLKDESEQQKKLILLNDKGHPSPSPEKKK